MALVPEYLRLLNALRSLEDDHWDLYNPNTVLRLPSAMQYMRPWRNLSDRESGVSCLVNNSDQFKVNLDVQQFKPEQISVKVGDKFVVIEGKHEEKADEHGFISRQFQRRYLLPDDVDPETVVSQLSSDGVLTIEAPKKNKPELERAVPIVLTKKPAIKNEKKKDEAEKMQQ